MRPICSTAAVCVLVFLNQTTFDSRFECKEDRKNAGGKEMKVGAP